jgi:hypothetical protein
VVSYPEIRRELHGTVKKYRTVIRIGGAEGELKLSLKTTEFNGDASASGYLGCEFPDGDRYALNAIGPEIVGCERDLTRLFCTSRREREFTRRTAGNAKQEVQSRTDRDVVATD